MEQYKQEFIRFMIECGVLQFGEFTLKSGRKAPFYVNTGNFQTGSALAKLGTCYARAIRENFGTDFDVLFGPAYKGIPLAAATVIALAGEYGADIRYCANRKEVKDHGDKGILLGSPIRDKDRIVIIEDVTTAGTSVRETVPLLKAQADAELLGLVVSVDRMERGSTDKTALQEISETWGIKTAAIVTMAEVVDFLYNREIDGRVLLDDGMKEKIDAYYAMYGGR